MKCRKLALLGSVSMLALAATSGSALAFNEVSWSWDAEVVDRINKTITVDVAFEPTGMVHVEIPQIHIGDSIATATMRNVSNNPQATREDRTFDFTATGQTEGSLDVSGTAEGFVDIDNTGNGDFPNQQSINGFIGIAGTPDGLSQSDGGVGLVDGALGDEPAGLTVDGVTSGSLDVAVSGTITVPVVVPLDAVAELPKFDNIATALGNNLSIESQQMVEAHTGQFSFGDGGNGGPSLPGGETSSFNGEGGNTFLTMAELLTLGAGLGLIEPANIEATATVRNLRNGQVENAATAIANNLSLSLDAVTPGDAVVVGDLTQFAFADVSATADMANVRIRNYNNLGGIEGALFSNTATSIGNNLSISVKGPSVGVPNGGLPGGTGE